MRKSYLWLLLGLSVSGCATENVSGPNAALSNLTFLSVHWDVRNIPIVERSSGSSQFVGQEAQFYDHTTNRVISIADSIGNLTGQDPLFSFKGNRAPTDIATVVIDQQRKVLNLSYEYSMPKVRFSHCVRIYS